MTPPPILWLACLPQGSRWGYLACQARSTPATSTEARQLVPHASHIYQEHGAAHDEKSGDGAADCPGVGRLPPRPSGRRGHPDHDQGKLTAGGTRDPAPLWHVAGARQAGARGPQPQDGRRGGHSRPAGCALPCGPTVQAGRRWSRSPPRGHPARAGDTGCAEAAGVLPCSGSRTTHPIRRRKRWLQERWAKTVTSARPQRPPSLAWTPAPPH